MCNGTDSVQGCAHSAGEKFIVEIREKAAKWDYHESLKYTGTGGTPMLPFLENIQDASSAAKLTPEWTGVSIERKLIG